MLYSIFIINDRRKRISNLLDKIKDDNFAIEKSKFVGYCYDLILALDELSFTRREIEFESFEIKNLLKNIKNIDNSEDLKRECKDTIDKLLALKTETYTYTVYTTISHSDNYIKNIFNKFKKSDRELNIFEPNCGNGDNARVAKEFLSCNYYGSEYDNDKAEQAKSICKKVAKGSLKGSRISNDVFDIVFSKANIEYELEKNMFQCMVQKPEKLLLMNTTKYARGEGILVFSIPYFRMHKDICAFIAKNFYDINIIKDGNFTITLFMKKRMKRLDNADSTIYSMLRKCCFNNIDDDSFLYSLPNLAKEIETFKGSILDEEEAIMLAKTSGALDTFFKKQEVKKISESKTQPLLPFNLGQIGLILTSGCLDGIINENDSDIHLVKGKVSKKAESENTYEDGKMIKVETFTNKVEINILLPDGTFKTLT